MGEVEAQPARVDQRALLAGVLAQLVAERPVEGVGGGVAAGDRPAAVGVDLGVHLVADRPLARHHPGAVDREPLEAGPGVGDLEHGPAAGADQAGVADLAATLGVERRPVQDQLDLVAL